MSLSNEINAITECSICTEPFADPRVLPCVHTFCLKCLESYGKSKTSRENLSCPICRAKLPPGLKFTDLPVNFFIQKLLEVNKIAGGPTSSACDACCDQNDSTNSANFYCFDCRQSLCDQCCQVHNKLRYNRSHQVAEFGKKQAEELLKVSPTFCDAHQDEIVKFYCSDCEASICMSCYVEEHSSHKCSNILKVSDGFLHQLKEDSAKVSEHITTCFSEEEKLKRKKTEFLQDIRKKESQISATIKELHGHVNEYGKQILAEVRSIKEVKLKDFEVTENEIHDHLMMMESFKRYSEEVVTKATPADITRLSKMLRKRAAELHAIRLDNDFRVFDVDIISSDLKEQLVGKAENPVCDFMVYNSRKEYDKAFASPYTFIPYPETEKKAISEMATIGHELYLLSGGVKATTSDNKRCIGSEVLKISAASGAHVSSYSTSFDSIIFHLQLWICKSSTGETLQLQVSNLSLAENDGNLETFIDFTLPALESRQPSNLSQNFMLKSPQNLAARGIYGMYFNPQVVCTPQAIRVQPTVQLHGSGVTQEEIFINIPLSGSGPTKLPTCILLGVYDMQPDQTEAIHSATSKTIAGAVIKMKLPETFTGKGGNPVQRTSYTQSDSVLLHVQLNYSYNACNETATLALRISKLSLSYSGGAFVATANLSVQPYSLQLLNDINHDISLKATQNFINAGFYGIDLRFHISTTSDTVKVDASVINISTVNGDYPSEAKVNIPTSTRTGALRLKREINLPSTIDPSGMVSCNYHKCVYIGDRQSSCIYRIEPTGGMTKWPVAEVPDGLSVTPNHTLIVTFGKSLKLNVYDTHGCLLHDVKLTGLGNPLYSVIVSDHRFLVLTGSAPIYLASIAESRFTMNRTEESISEEASIKEMILYSNNETKLNAFALQAESHEGIVVTAETSGTSENQTVAEADRSAVQLNGPVHVAVDRFGYVFILTTDDAKVHLLSPQLNYVRELISLDRHGMEKPTRIHFDNETGILYVQSMAGRESLLGFQVTEGKVDPSVWRKDI